MWRFFVRSRKLVQVLGWFGEFFVKKRGVCLVLFWLGFSVPMQLLLFRQGSGGRFASAVWFIWSSCWNDILDPSQISVNRICQGVSVSFYTPLTGVQYIRPMVGHLICLSVEKKILLVLYWLIFRILTDFLKSFYMVIEISVWESDKSFRLCICRSIETLS